jgi:hypothetical protein
MLEWAEVRQSRRLPPQELSRTFRLWLGDRARRAATGGVVRHGGGGGGGRGGRRLHAG